jgi:uncharacterized protein (DUF1330 family)
MTAYVVFIRERMRNRREYEVYRDKSRPVNASHPLKALALYGQHEVLEGPALEGAVILEFPSIEAAKAYYHSAATKTQPVIDFLVPTTAPSLSKEYNRPNKKARNPSTGLT